MAQLAPNVQGLARAVAEGQMASQSFKSAWETFINVSATPGQYDTNAQRPETFQQFFEAIGICYLQAHANAGDFGSRVEQCYRVHFAATWAPRFEVDVWVSREDPRKVPKNRATRLPAGA